MADDEAQGQEDTSWLAFDAFADSSLPSTSFDEPLMWPDAGAWEEPPAGGSEGPPLLRAEHPDDLEAGLLFPPTPQDPVIEHAQLPNLDVQWQASGQDAGTTVHHDQALGGLGGGADLAASADSGPAVEPLSESIWADTPGTNGDIGLISTIALPTPPVYPAAARSPEGPLWRRLDLRQGNAAVVGLISLVSLVLLGMFLSVRARNDLLTDSSQSRRPSNEISVTGSLNTVPLTTTVTTTVPAAAINIADLLPAVDADVEPTGNATAAEAGSGSRSPATTAAPARRTGPSGGGGSTTPAAEPAAKAPAPNSPPAPSAPVEPEPITTRPDTSPTVDTTQPRRPSTTFTVPTFPTTSTPGDDTPSYTIPPSWRGTRN